MDDITVDRETLKALGADTRINILKKLSERRMTQAELAAGLGLAAPSVAEHLAKLESADLVQPGDSNGHKWKYYELTAKGAAVVRPSSARILLMLGLTLLAFTAALFYFTSPGGQTLSQSLGINSLAPFFHGGGSTQTNAIPSPSPQAAPAVLAATASPEKISPAGSINVGEATPPAPPDLAVGASPAAGVSAGGAVSSPFPLPSSISSQELNAGASNTTVSTVTPSTVLPLPTTSTTLSNSSAKPSVKFLHAGDSMSVGPYSLSLSKVSLPSDSPFAASLVSSAQFVLKDSTGKVVDRFSLSLQSSLYSKNGVNVQLLLIQGLPGVPSTQYVQVRAWASVAD